MPPPSESIRRWTPLRVAAIVAFWTLIGLASGVQARVMGAFEGRDISLVDALVLSIPPWWFWAVATPAVAWMARRFRFDAGRLPVVVVAHLVGALVATACHTLWLGTFFAALGVTADMTESTGEYLRLVFVSRLYLDLLVYWAILGAVHAFDYHDRFRERELRATRLEAQLARARLDTLRMQLNPHFLFNALNAVSAQVRAGRGVVATSMLSGLGDLLRYVLDSEEDALVPLSREMAFLERYVEIERIRFADRLTVEIDVPPELGEARVPSLMLQPLVENAVRHGVAPREGPGRIEVGVTRRGSRLALTVRDDGVGLDAHRGAEGDETLPVIPRDGVGLTNTRTRLRELFGADHRFEVGPRPGGGTEVRIEIPFGTSS